MVKRYQPLGPLMAGEGSRAFLGLELVDDRPGEPVVLIFVPPELVADAELFAKLQRDTERATIFDHPNIIRVHGLAQTAQGPARVVEYAAGESVRRLLDAARKLPLPIAARIVADAATGVHYGHLAGNDDGSPLVHGDLRPETLLVSAKGITQVTGYGALGVAPRERNGQRVKGRRQHSAPEQLVGGRDTVNVQTDVFLLGLLFHELLTGKVPFTDAPDFDQAVLTTPVARIGDLAPAAMEVIDRATAKKVPQRYPSALALREAIEAACPLATHVEVAAELRRRFSPKHPAVAARKALLDAAHAGLEQLVSLPVPSVAIGSSAGSPLTGAAPAAAAPPAAGVPSPVESASGASMVVAPTPARPAAESASTASSLSGSRDERTAATGAASARSRGWVTGLVAAALLVGVGLYFHARSSPELPRAPVSDPVTPQEPLAEPGGAEAEAPVLDAGTGTASAPPAPPVDPGVSPAARAHAAALGVPVSELQSPSGKPAAPAQVVFALATDPPVEVTIDGKPVGRSPVEVEVEPGRRKIQLVDRAQGINLARYVTVGRKGETRERIYIGRGYINVTAPLGSEVFLDGKLLGEAPVREYGVFEGSHRILVKLGEATWEQPFQLADGERMNFDVQTQPD